MWQVQYAAADAACLVQLWVALQPNTYGCAPRSMHIHESEVVQVLLQQANTTADQCKPADVGAEFERLGVVNQMIVAAAAAVSDPSLADGSMVTEGNSTFAEDNSTLTEGNTILFIVDEVPVVVLVQKGSRVPVPDLAAAFGVRKKRVRLARADECVTYTGILPFTAWMMSR